MVQARMEDDYTVGEVAQLVPPGGDFLGHSHDEVLAMGNGEHEFKPTPDGFRHSGRNRR